MVSDLPMNRKQKLFLLPLLFTHFSGLRENQQSYQQTQKGFASDQVAVLTVSRSAEAGKQ